jgi:hypothetical protein
LWNWQLVHLLFREGDLDPKKKGYQVIIPVQTSISVRDQEAKVGV